MPKILLLSVILSFIFHGCGSEGSKSNNNSINSKKDTTPPTIKLKGESIVRMFVGDSFVDPGVSAIDDFDGDVTSFIKKESDVDMSKAGNYKITYTVSDRSGNSAKISRDIRVFFKPVTNIYISEFLANNNVNRMDPDFYAFSDWIELYNNDSKDIDISGYGLTDDKNKLPWKIPEGTILKAHSYMIFWADKKNEGIHTNFSLGRKGEEIFLYDKNGNLIDYIVYQKQKSDVSYGRDQNMLWEYMEPTFSAQNIATHILTTKRSEQPVFSVKEGFYSKPQTVIITTNDNGQIHYTLDGSFPTKDSPLYTKAITVNKNTTLRAINYKEGLIKSKEKAATYFIDWNTDLPVVSLATDPKYFFDDKIGIYVTGTNGVPLYQCRKEEIEKHNYAREWQRPIHLEYFNNDKQEDFSLNLDIEITGQCSRHNPKKSFALEVDGKYGTKTLKYKLYKNKDIDKIKDFRLRTGDLGYKLRDLVSVVLVEDAHLNIDYQSYRTVQLFLNGQYWGIYNIREKKGVEYLKSNYPDINKSNIDLIGIKVKSGDRIEYDKLHKFIKEHDLSNAENYQYIKENLDIENFIDYMILEIYSNNDDWPFNNFRVWRERRDGAKWRWILEDLDYGFIRVQRDINAFTRAQEDGILMTDLFRKLLENSDFKTKFKDRFNYLLDTLFNPENVLALINKLVDERREYFYYEPKKWNITIKDFDYDVNLLKNFAQKRAAVVRAQLNNL
jgi:hypothetical protein